MEKSRKYMIAAAGLLFISQFFNYSTRVFFRPSTDMDLNYHGGALIPSETGWQMHSWYAGIIIAVIAYLFYSSTRAMLYYIVCIICMLFLGIGDGTGAVMGIIAVAIAGYAIYLKRKESKLVKP